MKCEYYKRGSECKFAAKVYGKPALNLTEDEIDHIAESCILAGGVGCRDREGLTKKLNPQTAT